MSYCCPKSELTDAEVAAGARPGESWVDARRRLESLRRQRNPQNCTECDRNRWYQPGNEPQNTLCEECNADLLAELGELQREKAMERYYYPRIARCQ